MKCATRPPVPRSRAAHSILDEQRPNLARRLAAAGHPLQRDVDVAAMIAGFEHDHPDLVGTQVPEAAIGRTHAHGPVLLGQLPLGLCEYSLRAVVYFATGVVILGCRRLAGARMVDVADDTCAADLVALQHSWIWNADGTVTMVDPAASQVLKTWCSDTRDFKQQHRVPFRRDFPDKPMSAEHAAPRRCEQRERRAVRSMCAKPPVFEARNAVEITGTAAAFNG